MSAEHRPDWLVVEPRERYDLRASTHLNSHSLAAFRKCPRLLRLGPQAPTWRQEPQALLIGRAFHCLVLEGRGEFDRRFAVGGPVNPRTGRRYGRDTDAHRRWVAGHGKDAVDDDSACLLEAMKAGLDSSPHAVRLLGDGVGEVTVIGSIRGVPCQSRLDWLRWAGGPHDAAIVDLKTCGDLDEFEADSIERGHHRQLAFYRLVVESCSGGLSLPCMLVGVEKRAPNRCGTWRLDEALLADAARDVEAAVDALAECRRLDHWPTGYEEPRLLTA